MIVTLRLALATNTEEVSAKGGVYPRRFAVSADRAASVASRNKRPGHELSTGYPQCCTNTTTNNIYIC